MKKTCVEFFKLLIRDITMVISMIFKIMRINESNINRCKIKVHGNARNQS